jgi:3-deoxy-D-manno-octulosonic-acid transferase
MLTFYRMITALVYWLLWPYAMIRRFGGSRNWRDRLGYQRPEKPPATYDIWMHASSIGEVRVLSILLNSLMKFNNDISVYITVMTETGLALAQEVSGTSGAVGYLPLDYGPAVTRFLHRIRPRVAVILETEIWPNLIMELHKLHIPLFLANGRLSGKTCRRYRFFKSGMRRIMSYYAAIMVQTDVDKDRFISIGAPEDRIEVVGSLKFDAPSEQISQDQKKSFLDSLPFKEHSRIFTAGSTRNGENEMVLGVFKNLLKDTPGLKLILAPRHLERLGEICRLTERFGFGYRLYSETAAPPDDLDVVIVDRMGILNGLYAISDVAFVGGTLVNVGGHNILEPVWAGCPALYGPSIFNIQDSSDYIIEENFGAMVLDEADLYRKLALFFAGRLSFRTRKPGLFQPLRADRAAQLILDQMEK